MAAVIQSPDPQTARPPAGGPIACGVREHTVEIVSGSGEGAQKCGQIFGAISAKMGNGAWTVEIIPAEIQPPRPSPPLPQAGEGDRSRVRWPLRRVTLEKPLSQNWERGASFSERG